MEEIDDLSKYKSCENGVEVRDLRLAKSSLLSLEFIKGEVWYLDSQQWAEAAWAKNGKLLGVYNGMFWNCWTRGYNLSEAIPTIRPEVISKFKKLPDNSSTPKNFKQQEQPGQLNLFN